MNVLIRLALFSIVLSNMMSVAVFAEGGRFLFGTHKTPKPVPEIEFNDADGIAHNLKDFEGKYVLLNVWVRHTTFLMKRSLLSKISFGHVMGISGGRA